ncbi:hypothetical protein TruAng_000847 [Truncatella angustata]|nr:hypothetical protein TruAng_000847 [Truncatella angustata]
MSFFGRNDGDDSRGERRDEYDDRQGSDNRQGGYDGRRSERRDDYDDRQGERREDYPSGGNVTHGGSYPAGGHGRDDDDFSGAAQHASQHAGNSGDSSLFSSILGSLGQNKGRLAQEDVDEEGTHVDREDLRLVLPRPNPTVELIRFLPLDSVKQHQRMYGDGDDNDADDRSLGSAAAMQALKMFSGGSSGNSQSGNSQSAFIGLAMGEASKVSTYINHRNRLIVNHGAIQLFDQKSSQGKVSGGSSKESAVMQAGEMALKYYMKSQGGGSSSGTSGLMGLASKFL